MLPTDLLPLNTHRTADGHLVIGGCNVVALAREHGTPLYLYDQATMDGTLAAYRDALAAHWPGRAEVAYAAKAWLSSAMARWVAARGLGMDVVSEGELRHALHAGFPAERLHAHGNNKPDSFLRACVEAGVGRVVLDHAREAERLAVLCERLGRRQAVWLRLNPATAADTHAHIETGSVTSKFGLSLTDGSARAVAAFVHHHPHLDWLGLHFHIGSQFPDTAPLCAAIERVLAWLAGVQRELDWVPSEFSPGGGWAVPYTPGAAHLSAEQAIRELSEAWPTQPPPPALPPITGEGSQARGSGVPILILEPGRELVARAGVALYTVGAVKRAGAVRYAFVDGGLADNPRPALYEAQYYALLANRLGEGEERYTIAGPFCESGDVLIREVTLPELREGDLLAVPVSGAYQLSMASNYNGALRPAVLWLCEGRAQVAQRREGVEALWSRDCLVG